MRSRKADSDYPFTGRFMSVLSSLVFSVPTAMLIWLGVNVEAARWGAFLGASYLWVSIGIFALIAFVAPAFFPSMMGAIWRGCLKLWHWWGW